MSRIPITLITGFLGAGKTTFLNWLIKSHPELKISVILNEFGDTQLESEFVEQDKSKIVELSNGCMCCVAKSDIPRTIEFILHNSPETQYILVESSGLSDPDPIRSAFKNPKIAHLVRLDSTICIVDCVNYHDSVDTHPILLSQLGDSDIILLSKEKEAGKELTRVVRENVSALADDFLILETEDNLSPKLFLDPKPDQQITPEETNKEHEHSHQDHKQYKETTVERIGTVDQVKLKKLFNTLPKSIIRAKGFVYVEDKKGNPKKLMIQYVGSHPKYEIREVSQTETRQNFILFIGTEFDQEQLGRRVLECFLPL